LFTKQVKENAAFRKLGSTFLIQRLKKPNIHWQIFVQCAKSRARDSTNPDRVEQRARVLKTSMNRQPKNNRGLSIMAGACLTVDATVRAVGDTKK
jgi:hypothetical protein